MIVITAPTSPIGRHVVDDLLAAGASLRVIVRDPLKLTGSVRDRVEIARGSHGDADVVDRAFEGADALFWLARRTGAKLWKPSYRFYSPGGKRYSRTRG